MNKDVIASLSSIASVTPDIKSYYENKYSLTGPGLSDDGTSVYDLFVEIVAGVIMNGGNSVDIPEIAEDSDLYPLMQFFNKFNSRFTVIMIGLSHDTETYASLIKRIK